jgi:hypothetical protein
MDDVNSWMSDAGSCCRCGARSLAGIDEGDEDLPHPGSVVRVWNQSLRFLGIATDRLVLATTNSPFALFLVPDANGVPGLMERARFADLVHSGQAKVLAAVPDMHGSDADEVTAIAAERLMVECEMLDAAGVPQGTKAIDIFIHDHWSDALRARFGEPDNPHTIRRWRARRAREAPT